MLSRPGAVRSMRPHCAHAKDPCAEWGPSAPTHRGHVLSEAPVRSRTGGQEFHEAPMHSCTGAMHSMRPHCVHAQGSCAQ